jgi:hypothetical protein
MSHRDVTGASSVPINGGPYHTPCGNGDFEQPLNPSEWAGAHGSIPGPPPPTAGPGDSIIFSSLTPGISGGAVTSGSAHQTWVTAPAFDSNLWPAVHLPVTAQNSSGAVRIGNAAGGAQCSVLRKTFQVTPAQTAIKFWYAVVLQHDPVEPNNRQPFFWVRVTLANTNTIVAGAVHLENNSDRIVADASNVDPYFGVITDSNKQKLYYTDWKCAEIDLSSVIGKLVNIDFVTGHSVDGKYWGYAYVDSVCGECKGSHAGDLTYDCEASSHCGNGKICFRYELPQTGGPGSSPTYQVYGTVTITLEIYQNGTLKTSLTSPTLITGTPQGSYCFDITPAALPNLDPSLGGFDFSGRGTFTMPFPWTNMTVLLGDIRAGNAPYGVTPGQNNDYLFECPSCSEITKDQEASLRDRCTKKANVLPRINCHCPDAKPSKGDCNCKCVPAKLPDLQPCISVRWGDRNSDCVKPGDVQIACVTVCNCYSNVAFQELTIARIVVSDSAGNPAAHLPDGNPSVQVLPTGPICFGDIPPCTERDRPGCISRELVIDARGATGKGYRLSFEGICFTVSHHVQTEQCFVLPVCG